jgi:hypothetical protein
MYIWLNRIVVFALIALIVWSAYKYIQWNDHRNQVMEATMADYEACIKDEYNVHPSDYYNKNNKYPICQKWVETN